MENKKLVYYEDFGAIGDGVADDLPAIAAAHEYANTHHLPVKASDTATYYIGGKNISAKIMTDTDFGKAHFVIDDRKLENYRSFVFEIVSGNEFFTPEIKEVKAGQRHIDFPHEGNVFVRVEGDPEKRVFIRKGLNMDSGSVPGESFIVDGDGNILTDINWDYSVISSAMAKSVDDEPITVEGGIFTTVANEWICEYAAHARGFNIIRSHVTVRNVEHYVVGEGDHGAPYGGFFSLGKCYDTVLEDIILTPHFTYQMPSKVPGKMVAMGTYDLLITHSIKVLLKNITQSISIDNTPYWGLMGSNYGKEIYLENCIISRFDAHCGVTNGAIRGCTLGHAGINLIGYGEFTIEDTEARGGNLVCFRADYGSNFAGKLVIKNCKWVPRYNGNMSVFSANNDGTHYFGYDCHMGKEIIIDGLTIDESKIDADKTLTLLPMYDQSYEEGKPYPLATPDKITVSNVKTVTGREMQICIDPNMYKRSEITLK